MNLELGVCVIRFLTYLLKVALFLLIGVQYLQESLVDLRLTLEPILPTESKYTE